MIRRMTSFLASMAVVFAIGYNNAHAQTAEELFASGEVLPAANYENTLLGQRMSENPGLDALTHMRPVSSAPFFRMPKLTAGSSFRGCVINDANWQGNHLEYGLYDITPSNGVYSPCFIDDTLNVMHADYGSSIVGNHYYFVTGYSVNGIIFYIRYAFDLETMKYENANMAVPGQSPSYLAWTNTPYDAATGKSYGLFFTEDGNDLEFCAMDYVTMTREAIGVASHVYLVMAVDDSDGQLYAIDEDGDLYRLDKTTGAGTYVGATGLHPSSYRQAAAVDAAVGKLFWTYILDDNSCGVAEVDLKTAHTEKMLEFDRVIQFGDLYNIAHGVEGEAPAQVDNLVWNYNEANYENIDLAFTMPTMTNDGSKKLSGQLTYTVMCGETVVAQGTAVPGGKVATTIGELPQQQVVKLTVFASNNIGKSMEQEVEVWAGLDLPLAPSNVTLAVNGGNVLLTWSEVSTGAHGGYVEADKIEYVVRKQPEGVVKTTTKDTSFSETINITQLDYLTYSVEAVTAGVGASEPSFSNSVKVGEYLSTPYVVTFGSSFEVDGYWDVVDGNSDGVTWEFDGDSKFMSVASSNLKANDWLISPPIYLEQGSGYSIRMQARTTGNGVMSLAYGTQELTPPNGYTTIIDATALPTTMEETTLEGSMVPLESGVYRFAVRVTENTLSGSTELRRFSVSAPSRVMPPKAPSDFTVVAGEKGELTATVSFVTPQQATDGSNLGSLSSVEILRNNQVIATLQNVGVGEAVTYVDDQVPADGKYVYAARVSAYGVPGEAASQEVYVGKDLPAPPAELTFVDNGNGTATLRWTNQLTGANGGYVDATEMDNKVYSAFFNTDMLPLPYNAATIMDQCQLDDMMALLKDRRSYTEAINLEGEPGWVLRAVTTVAYFDVEPQDTVPQPPPSDDNQIPVFDEGAVINNNSDILANGFAMVDDDGVVESKKASVAFLIKGTPVTLPMTESFANKRVGESAFWWTRPLNGTAAWQLTDDALDGDGGAVTFAAKEADDEALLGTRKISLNGTTHPVLSFDYKGGADCAAMLKILVDRGQTGVVDTLSEIFIDELNEAAGYERAYIDLESYIDDNYVIVQLVASANQASDMVTIDNVELHDMPPHDLAVDAIVPKVMMTGSTAEFIVNVINYGTQPTENYSVSLTAEYVENGNTVTIPLLTDQGFGLGAMGGNDSYHAQMDITPFILGDVKIIAEVSMPGDADPSNNMVEKVMTASSVILPGTNTVMPAPYGLTATETPDGVLLQWGMVDNTLEYLTSYNEPMSFDFYGINVYVDGELYTTLREPVTETVVQGLADGEHVFYITLLYGEEGSVMESPLSNRATIVTSIDMLMLDPAADIVVYNVNGVKVAEGKAALGRLPKGVYVVYDRRDGTSRRMVKE